MKRSAEVSALLEQVWSVVEFADLKEPPDVESVGIFGSRPLKIVVTWGDINAVKLLLEAGANIDAQNEDGNTALHHALFMGHFEVARLLVAHGAAQTIRNNEGKLARDMCSSTEWTQLGLSHQ